MSADRDAPGGRPVLRVAVAAVLYLGLTVWSLRALLPSPSTLTTLPAGWQVNVIGDADISVMIWSTARNARTLVTRPWRLAEFETCYPTPVGAGFGAPYFMDGVLALPASLLGAPPVLIYNSGVLLHLWLAALGMFLLAYYWTQSFGAAFLGGLAFGLHPARIVSSHWPHVFGNEWVPFVLLFTHRLFARERWWDAVALSVFLGLQILGCFYQFLPFVVIEGPYVLLLLWRYRKRFVALAPKFVLVVAAAVACGAVQFLPALHVQRVWGTLTGRSNVSMPLEEFFPGKNANVGVVAWAMIAVALVDRLRARRSAPPDDPRLVIALGGMLALWTVVYFIPIPGTRHVIPSLLALAGKSIPGLRAALEAVRAIQLGYMGVYAATGLLAAFGVAALQRGRSPVAARAIAGVLIAMILAEGYVPALATLSFSRTTDLEGHTRGLDPKVTELERRTLAGPVLDLPAVGEGIQSLQPNAHAIMLATFHHRPLAACYNSFTSALSLEVADLANRLPELAAADDLRALGFEYVVVHGDMLGKFTDATLARLRTLQLLGRVVPVDAAAEHWVFALKSPLRVTTTFPAPLEVSAPQIVSGLSAEVGFPFRNPGGETYRHPDPIEPSEVVVRWYGAGDAPVAEERTRLLLPIALAPTEQIQRKLKVMLPATPGAYRVTLARAAAPDFVRAVAWVQVHATP